MVYRRPFVLIFVCFVYLQMEISFSERPCSFIPPPPPSEPPPPDQQPVDFKLLTLSSEPIFIDKGTEVNDDNTSLGPSSTKSSPSRGMKMIC